MERKKEKKKKAKRGGTFEEDEGGQMCVSVRFIFFFFFLSRDELIQMTHRFSFKCPQTFFFSLSSILFLFFFFCSFFFPQSCIHLISFFFLSVCVCAGFSRRVSYSNCAALSDCVMSSSLSASSSSSFFFPLSVWLLMTIRRGGERVELVFNRFPLSLSLSG